MNRTNKLLKFTKTNWIGGGKMNIVDYFEGMMKERREGYAQYFVDKN